MQTPAEIRVADRIYYDEPATLEFVATVTAIREVARVDGRQVWQIALDRTAFYPVSGGQPFDTGVLIATARSGASLHVPITAVEEDEAGEVWHTTGKPLQEGTTIRGVIDAERRSDHMQQHSGQHLLSAILRRDLDAATVSFHLGAQQSTIDLACGPLADDALVQAERTANEAIRQALPIAVRYASRAEAEAMLREGQLAKLPPRDGRIRLVEIAGLDLNACGGTHVSNTAAIGPVLLRGTERVRNTVRLAFVCGERALAAARSDFQLLDQLARSLSTGVSEISGTVAQLQADRRAAGKERALLLRALAAEEAFRLAAAPRTPDSPVIYLLDPPQPGRDAAYAKLLATALVTSTAVGVALVIVPDEPGVVAQPTASAGARCSVVLAAKAGVLDCGKTLQAALAEVGGRGGGSADVAQGSLPRTSLEDFLGGLRSRLVAGG